MNLALLLDMAADAFGERSAATCAGQTLTYGELRRAARQAARTVRAGGFAHAALLDTNGLAAAVAPFAAAYAGVPYVPLNYRLTPAELGELLERVAPAWLLAPSRYLERVQLPPNVTCAAPQLLAQGAGQDFDSAEAAATETQGSAVAIQLFTSGTTGKPKAALLRHEHVMSYILGTVEFGAAGAREAALISVPPYHIAGISAVLSSTYAGRRIVMLPDFAPADWVRLVEEEGITHAFLVPTMLVRILDYLGEQGASPRLSTLRAVAYGGGRMPLTVIERALSAFPAVEFTNAYGLTETSATICLLTPQDHRLAAASAEAPVRRRLASVGQPLPTIELEVRDEAGQRLGAGQPGLIYVRGAQIAGEYRDAGSRLDEAGFFCTQDRGWVDAAGYVFLAGRADDVIVRGGENISPGEIEEVLLAHAAVADAVVVGVASEQWGETVAAAVVVRAGNAVSVELLQQWVRARLRSSRVPECIVFRSELPYNEMGKVLRHVLRRELAGAS